MTVEDPHRGKVGPDEDRVTEEGPSFADSVFRPGAAFRRSEVGRSIIRRPPTRLPWPATTPNVNFLFHPYPVRVPKEVLSFRSTGRLGFISVVLLAILTVTGAYLMFFYRPATPDAYFDMKDLGSAVVFGQIVRNAHRWSAQLMIVVVAAHMIRVFVSGAYKAPRQFNWVIGMGLFLATLGLSFTGYLLPWDQLALWAVTVGTNIAGFAPLVGEKFRQALLGGADIGSAALVRFYVLHIYVLPALAFILLGVHLWRIRKDGFAVGDRDRSAPDKESNDV